MEARASLLGELDERPLSPGRATRLHQNDFWRDAPGPLAPLPNPHKTARTARRTQRQTAVGAEHLARVTVEHPDYEDRIDLLCQTGAHIKFLSLEPLLAPMPRLKLRGINWVIVGGESGPGARPMLAEWFTDIRDQCRDGGVAFHFKQWGGVFKKRNGRLLESRTWDEMPAVHTRMLASTPTT